MDDLISRKAAIEALNMNGCCGMGITYLLDCDSVPAVPLDKLCDFLGGAVTPCILLNIGCPYNDANRRDCDSCRAREAWKITLSKWMEEQDANRE